MMSAWDQSLGKIWSPYRHTKPSIRNTKFHGVVATVHVRTKNIAANPRKMLSLFLVDTFSSGLDEKTVSRLASKAQDGWLT